MAKSTILNSVEEVIEDFRNGRIVIVVDDEDRENEGDFIVAAEKITPEIVNFMLKEGRGVLWVNHWLLRVCSYISPLKSVTSRNRLSSDRRM